MGIPIGWNIKREDAKEKDVLRADVTGQRSPIRRRIITNPPRSQSAFDTDFLISTSRFAPHPEPISRASHDRTRLPPPPVPEVSRSAYRSNETSREPPSLQREDASFRRSRSRVDGYMRAYATRAALDDERPTPALTPGFAPAAAAASSRTAELEALRGDARILERTIEQIRHPRWQDSRPTRSRSPLSDQSALRRGNEADYTIDDPQESSDNNAVGFPPLRRMGRRNIADGPLPASSLRESWSPASTVDGLGDRDRSLSPFDENLPWDNFLSTVVPDPVAPTAESSFASAAASASFPNSHPSSRAGSSNTSASSSRTHLTVPSRRHSPGAHDQFMRACDTSEDDTASDTEAEEDETAPTAEAISHRYNPITLRRRSRPSYFSDEPPNRDTDRYSRRVMERTRDASSYVRSFYNSVSAHSRSLRVDGPRMEQLDGPVDGPAPASDDDIPHLLSLDSSLLDQELREARSLLERLSRREDVSDDFWASVGLTRSFADRVESFNERQT
ncbi:hypothetical protein EK21DRAFT_96680 [Setomelanomma holmii]|uniref:Uncharacterized protein n=1 Tax=Setomelanomma holmii TaxID=210430 RepID=A0A9P4HLI7_9PLEO|nr:hypothetical protein EK21DRAFT_96680 [Setomelanomma holmii]